MTYQEQAHAKEEAEDERPGEVGVVEDVFVDLLRREEHGLRLEPNVLKVDPEL